MFRRYAVYFTPKGRLADAGAAWLGWDIRTGQAIEHPVIDGLDPAALTSRPRRYGFHGTIIAPFRLAPGATEAGLRRDAALLCRRLAPVALDGIEVGEMGGFVALTPVGSVVALKDLASTVVRSLDHHRAPLDASELARRRKASLTADQNANLETWGYPYVMDAFRFHITLTGQVGAEAQRIVAVLQKYFGPDLKRPFKIDSLTLVGEGEGGRFIELERFLLKR